MDNMNVVFDVKVTIRGTLHTLTSIKEILGQSCSERRRKRQEFCLITGFAFGKIPGLQNSPFCDRVFPNKIAEPLKKIRVLELLELIRKPEMWSALCVEDSFKVCLLLVSNKVFMGRESKNYIAGNLIELVDDLTAWDAYPWGEYFWRASYRRKKTKKFDSSKKIETYNVYGFVWSLKFEKQSKQVVESILVFISKELVVEYHSITTSVQLIENVGDGDPSNVLKELAAVKQMMNAIERFIKSRNDNFLEDSVAKQSVEKEIKSSNGKPDSAISNVFIGEISCENLVQEQLQSRDMCIQSIVNQIVQHPLVSPKGKVNLNPPEYMQAFGRMLVQVLPHRVVVSWMKMDTL
nr:phospholipase-like protein [Tanacetum cinerariifolium]